MHATDSPKSESSLDYMLWRSQSISEISREVVGRIEKGYEFVLTGIAAITGAFLVGFAYIQDKSTELVLLFVLIFSLTALIMYLFLRTCTLKTTIVAFESEAILITEYFLDRYPDLHPYQPINPNDIQPNPNHLTQSYFTLRSRVFLYALITLSSFGVGIAIFMIWPLLSATFFWDYSFGSLIAISLSVVMAFNLILFLRNQIKKAYRISQNHLLLVIGLKKRRVVTPGDWTED